MNCCQTPSFLSPVGWPAQGPAWGISPLTSFLLQAIDSAGHLQHLHVYQLENQTLWHTLLVAPRRSSALLAGQREFCVQLPFTSWTWCGHEPLPLLLGAQKKTRGWGAFPKTFP